MDYSNVLTALEELEKWRNRRAKIEKRLVAIRRERGDMQRELEAVDRGLSGLAGGLFRPEERAIDAHILPPFRLER